MNLRHLIERHVISKQFCVIISEIISVSIISKLSTPSEIPISTSSDTCYTRVILLYPNAIML